MIQRKSTRIASDAAVAGRTRKRRWHMSGCCMHSSMVGALALTLGAMTHAHAADTGSLNRATYNAAPVLQHVVADVIVPIYGDLTAATQTLQTAVQALTAHPTADRVQSARRLWRAARVPWENGEAFLYGPAASEGYDPRLDSWPLDARSLETVVESKAAIDQALVDSLDDNLRGYHTLEYLLWSDGGDAAQADPAAVAAALEHSRNRRAYLNAVAADMHRTAEALYDAWRPSGGDFAQQVADAGTQASPIYPTQHAALQEMVGGMIDIASETAHAKLGEPFAQRSPQLLESQYSFNSRTDFINNMRSVRHIYRGRRSADASGPGVSDFVRQVGGQPLDAAIRGQINRAIARIRAIDPPFSDAIDGSSAQRMKIQAAIDACTQVADTLQHKVLPLVEQTRFSG